MLDNYELTQRFIRPLGFFALVGHVLFYFLCAKVFGFVESAPLRAAVAISAVPLLFYSRWRPLAFWQKVYWEIHIAFDAITAFWCLLFLNDFNQYWFSSTVFAAMIYGLLVSRVIVALVVPFFVGLGIALIAARQPLPAGWEIKSLQVFAVATLAMVVAIALRMTFDRMYRQLQTAHARLKELDKAKSEFFQNVSHEFRTPLTLIAGPIESALAGHYAPIPDELKEPLSIVQRNCRRLLRLINQLLDIARIDAGATEVRRQLTDVGALLCGVAAAYESAAKLRDLELTCEVPSEPVRVAVDAEMLEKILNNLISNALKFTQDGGKVLVKVATDRNQLTITVKDTGCGIPKEKQQAVFERFRQVDSSSTRHHEGTGIGLSLVKELVHLHGGQIRLVSEPGFGAEFTVVLPHACAPADRSPSSELETTRLSALAAEDEARSTRAATVKQTEKVHAARENRPCVLVAEDNADMRAYIEACLTKAKFDVQCVANGRAALAAAAESPPDLIISDVMMPEMDGIELLSHCRHSERLSQAPFIVLTAKAGDGTLIEVLRLGADDYLTKPFDAEELVARVERIIRLRRLTEENGRLKEQIARRALSRYLSPCLVERVIRGELPMDGEPTTALLTVLFADLVGFTPITEQLRAQRIFHMLSEYWDTMTDVIFRHEGTVEKYIGDAIVVLFGAPVSSPASQQANAAAACAFEMQQQMAKLNARWQAEGLPAFSLRIGIHQGPAVVGKFGSEQRSHFTAIGSTLNIASRIEGVCAPGAIFLSSDVADFLPEGSFEYLGLFDLKGIPHQVTLYRLAKHPLKKQGEAICVVSPAAAGETGR
jgi:adenylate cyclase